MPLFTVFIEANLRRRGPVHSNPCCPEACCALRARPHPVKTLYSFFHFSAGALRAHGGDLGRGRVNIFISIVIYFQMYIRKI